MGDTIDITLSNATPMSVLFEDGLEITVDIPSLVVPVTLSSNPIEIYFQAPTVGIPTGGNAGELLTPDGNGSNEWTGLLDNPNLVIEGGLL